MSGIAFPPASKDAQPWFDRLFPFQVEGASALIARDRVLLADEMGLGKTIQAIAALRALKAGGRLDTALIVAPAGLITQWRMQLYEWAPELVFSTVRGPQADRSWQWRTKADVYIVSYDTLRSDFSLNPHSPVSRTWSVVILDEAQRIKNRDSDAARVCKQLNRLRSWALTGTPLENRLDDTISLLEFVQGPGTTIASSATAESVRSALAEVQVRRRKADVLPQLPPKTVITVPLDLSPTQRRTYERAELEGVIELRKLGARITITHVFELILRLKQICNFCPETGESAKFDDLQERLESIQASGSRALVFSQFVDAPFGVQQLVQQLHAFQPLQYHGGLDLYERDLVIERFRRDPRHTALILSLKAGGTGLNLQEASYVFHFDRWWNPATGKQAEDRSHRMGQQLPVTVYNYVCTATIEERIEKILGEKQQLFDTVVDGGFGADHGGLSAAEAFALFHLRPPTTTKPLPTPAAQQ